MESRIERDVEDSFTDAHMRIHFAKHGTCRKTRIDDFILDKGHLIGRRAANNRKSPLAGFV